MSSCRQATKFTPAVDARAGLPLSSTVAQFQKGLEVELERGIRDPETNVSDDDEITTGKIARAHLNEFPDYYTRLAEMEGEAERYWSARDQGPPPGAVRPPLPIATPVQTTVNVRAVIEAA